jgi:DNA-directed RNA polymerase subunit M/transcription elongation factor TFIIS
MSKSHSNKVNIIDDLHNRMLGGKYTHADETIFEITDVQQEILVDLFNKYPPQVFKQSSVNTLVKNTREIYCSVCGSDNVHVMSKQLRSADEATSKIYTCINCGNKWRVG